MRRPLRCHWRCDLADDAVFRGEAAMGQHDRVAHGMTATGGDDHLVGRGRLLTLVQLEAGQGGGRPGVRLDRGRAAGIRTLQCERNRHVDDDAVDSRKGGDVAHRIGGQRHAFPQGNREILRYINLLRRADHDVCRGIALGRQTPAHAGLDEHSEAGHQRARDEHRDRHPDEAPAVVTKIRADESAETQLLRHHHSPSALMRSVICCAVPPSRCPAKAPSARKITRSACDATTGSCVTTTTVWFSSLEPCARAGRAPAFRSASRAHRSVRRRTRHAAA
jgi:hypothetical protein